MTQRLMSQYFRDRSFYQLQAGQLVDNPDQRIAADVRWGLGWVRGGWGWFGLVGLG